MIKISHRPPLDLHRTPVVLDIRFGPYDLRLWFSIADCYALSVKLQRFRFCYTVPPLQYLLGEGTLMDVTQSDQNSIQLPNLSCQYIPPLIANTHPYTHPPRPIKRANQCFAIRCSWRLPGCVKACQVQHESTNKGARLHPSENIIFPFPPPCPTPSRIRPI